MPFCKVFCLIGSLCGRQLRRGCALLGYILRRRLVFFLSRVRFPFTGNSPSSFRKRMLLQESTLSLWVIECFVGYFSQFLLGQIQSLLVVPFRKSIFQVILF